MDAAARLGEPAPIGDNETLEDDILEPQPPTDPRSPAQRRADALVFIAAFFLDHHDQVTQGNSASINRAHVSVVVNLDQLTSAHLAGNLNSPYTATNVDLAAVLQACCDASITRILAAGSSLTLDIGRETRVRVTGVAQGRHDSRRHVPIPRLRHAGWLLRRAPRSSLGAWRSDRS